MIPMFQRSYLKLTVDQYANFGSSLADFSLDGSKPFTISMWVHIPTLGKVVTDITLFSKGGEFSLYLMNMGQSSATLCSLMYGQGQPTMWSPSIGETAWYNITVTYDATGNNSGNITGYINGIKVMGPTSLSNVGTTNNDDYQLGSNSGNFEGHFGSLCLWNTVLSSEDILNQMWAAPAPADSLISCYCFFDGSAMDHSGHNNPITLVGGAELCELTPCLQLQGEAYATPASADNLNPGGNPTDPFSICSWVCPTAASQGNNTPYVIFANGAMNEEGGVVCYLEPTGGNSFTYTVQQGTKTALKATTSITANQWCHVAATYDGQTLKLYVNGQLSGSEAPGNPGTLATPAPAIGAQINSSGAKSDYFQGELQAIQIWSIALSQDEVQQYMKQSPQWNTQGCTGNFLIVAIINNEQLRNLVTTNPATLDGVKLTKSVIPLSPSKGTSLSKTHVRSAAPKSVPVIRQMLKKVKEMNIDINVRPKTKLMSDSEIDNLISWYKDQLDKLPDISKELRAEWQNLFTRNLYGGIMLTQQSEGSLPGMITSERVGDEYVFHQHHLDGRTEVSRCSATTLTKCQDWTIDLASSLISCVVGVLGAVVSGSSATSFFQSFFSKEIKFATDFLDQLGKASGTVEQIKAGLEVIYQAGALFDVLYESLKDVSWWEWLFVIGELILQIVAIFLTDGWWVAAIFAEVAVGFASFITLLSNDPDHCLT